MLLIEVSAFLGVASYAASPAFIILCPFLGTHFLKFGSMCF